MGAQLFLDIESKFYLSVGLLSTIPYLCSTKQTLFDHRTLRLANDLSRALHSIERTFDQGQTNFEANVLDKEAAFNLTYIQTVAWLWKTVKNENKNLYLHYQCLRER